MAVYLSKRFVSSVDDTNEYYVLRKRERERERRAERRIIERDDCNTVSIMQKYSVWQFIGTLWNFHCFLSRKIQGERNSFTCRSQRAFRNTSYIREGLYECECRCLENWDILFYRESSEHAGGLFYEVTTKERLLGKWLLWAAGIYFASMTVRSGDE